MGFSIATSHLIFFIAVVALTAATVAVFTGNIEGARNSMTDKQNRLSDQLKTDVKIVNVYYDDSTSPDTQYVYVKNIGTKKLDTECINLFIDGDYIALEAADAVDPDTGTQTTDWGLEETIRLTAEKDLASDIHEAKLVTCNGVTASYDFST